MPEGQTDANNAGDSSNSAQTDANTTVDPSSTESEVAKPEPTMLDAMNQALEGTEGTTTSSTENATDPTKPPASTDAEGENQDGKTGADSEDVPFHDHPRWKEVLQERDSYKGQITELEAKVAESGVLQTELDTYFDQTGMDDTSFGELLQLGKLYRTDRAGFVKAMEPLIAEVQNFTGATLPDDLAAKVDAGTLDPESAKELAQSRENGKFMDEQRKAFGEKQVALDEANQAKDQQVLQQQYVQELRTVHDNWVDYQRKNDPDFAKMESMVLAAAKAHGGSGIKNPSEWATVLEQAKASVRDQLTSLIGNKGSMRHIQPSGGSDPGRSSPEPKTMRQAMEQSIHGGG